MEPFRLIRCKYLKKRKGDILPYYQEGREHRTDYYTGTQSFIITFFLFVGLIFCVLYVECPRVSTSIKGIQFLFHYLGVYQLIGHCLIPLDPCILPFHLALSFIQM